MGKLVITKKKNRLLLILFGEKNPVFMETASFVGEKSLLGNIYLAKVRDVVPGMGGAFLSVDGNQKAYLSFSECRDALLANRKLADGELPKQDDEIVVQITGEALKTKLPSAGTKLTLTGEYCVCSCFSHGIRYSKKLTEEKKRQIHEAIRNFQIEGRRKYRFTIRTNAENLDDLTPLFEEMKSFMEIFQSIADTCQYRTCYTCFYQKEAEIISKIQNIAFHEYDEIVTDEEAVYELLTETFREKKIRLYQDELLSLSKLYSIDAHLQEALGKKVWLKCGGYLIIEPTEAMVVIDVNSGRADGKGKKSRDYYLKVNLEAAREVARQLRIRNYSGMIMVDFINMESEEDNQKLLKSLDGYLKEDKVKTRLVDMTGLGIVEITRKKTSRPLSDFF